MKKQEYADKLEALRVEYKKSHFCRGDKVKVAFQGEHVLAYIFYRNFIYDNGDVGYVLWGTKNGGMVDKGELFASGGEFSDSVISKYDE